VLVFSDKLIFLFTSLMTQGLRIATTIAMARLLKPDDYGLLALVALPPGFLASLGDCGIAKALVQYRDLPTEITEASGLVVSVTLAVLYAMLWIISGFCFDVARHDPRLLWIGVIGGATMILSFIYAFQMACLNRDLKFRDESLQNIIFAAAAACTGVSTALAAHRHPRMGVFALALQLLVAQIVGNAVIYHRHPFRWPRAFRMAMAKKMLNYGWKVTLAQYINTVQGSLVTTVVFICGGTYGTGIYGRATQVSDLIGYNLMSSFDRLLHPLLRSVRDEQDRLRSFFVRGCIGTVLVCTFGWAWLVGTAPDLIRVVMGPQWGDVPLLLRVVCTSLCVNGLGTMGFVVINALGRPLVWLRLVVTNVAMLLVGLGLLMFVRGSLSRPLAGVTAVWAICQMTYYLSSWSWAMRTLRIPPGELIGHVARLIGAAVVTCGCILLVRHWMISEPALVRLMAGSLAGAAAFLGLVLLVDREAILDFRTLVRRRGPAQPPSPQTNVSEVPMVAGPPSLPLDDR
jgi:PST family polysaccharide transporter